MRDKSKSNYCKESGKYCYSSEAKASRAKSRYKDIKRVYFCYSCTRWHTTSMELPKTNTETIPSDLIKERLKFLKEK